MERYRELAGGGVIKYAKESRLQPGAHWIIRLSVRRNVNLVCVLAVMLLAPAIITAQIFDFTTNGDGTKNVVGFDEVYFFPGGPLTIPDTSSGQPVTSIGTGAFSLKFVTSLVTGNNLRIIGKGAFSQCNGLTNVIVGTNLVNIGTNAFFLCEGLTSITTPGSVNFPNTVTNIADGAFTGTELTNIITGNNLVFLGQGAFNSCPRLTSVTIGEGAS